MNEADVQYIQLVKKILDEGDDRHDRTGVGTKAIFGHQMRFNLKDGFPLLTTKRITFDLIKGELLWFLEGSSNDHRLAQITYGDPSKTTIWTANAQAPYWKPKASYDGDCGDIYGVMWRSWPGRSESIDQIENVIQSLKEAPASRRHVVVAFNPSCLDTMCLPPCHSMFQFFVNSKDELSCQLYQRSGDVALGIPYNIASYALLTHMIAQVCNLGVGEFIHTIGDAHIYSNHIEGLKKQISREPKKLSRLQLNSQIENINNFKMEDITLNNYECHPTIKFPFAV